MTYYEFALLGIYICGFITIGFEIYYMVIKHRWERLGTFAAIIYMLGAYARVLWFPHTFHSGEAIRIAIFYIFVNKVFVHLFNLSVQILRKRQGLPTRRTGL